MPISRSQIITPMNIYVDDSSHNMPTYVYAKQYDTNSRFINVTLLSNEGKYDVSSNTAQLNATKPDGGLVYVPAVTNEDGTVTVKLPQSLISVAGVVSCDISVFDEIDESTVILTSSTFYVIVDQSNYDENAIEGSDDFSTVAEAIVQMAGYKDTAQAAAESASDSATAASGSASDANDAKLAAIQAKEDAEAYAQALFQQDITFAMNSSTGHMTVTVNTTQST